MRTSISKESILKSSVLFLSISAFILSVLLFTSCSDSEGLETVADDATLISQIESATTEVVAVNNLPAATTIVFNGDLADSYVQSAELAVGLGYKVAVATDNLSREEATSDVYFSLAGKQLTDTNEKRRRRRFKCFEFVFPIDFIMADNSSITLNSKEDWTLIKDWYEANPDVTERPELVFPLDVTLKEDGTVQTLIDLDELKAIKDSCRKGKDKRKCFKLVLPVSFTMADASVIEVNERKDFKLLREWHKANPDVTEKPVLNFPVDIFYRDQTTATINDATEYAAAKDTCK
ncbi:hypothetical protein [Polaribacter sp. Hel1_85]|uniref:hypothetical protein n=1 Tax=Polaribacter sp. Hel1_85 TaxID=1250005 RepID=UPI00052E466A|nr:hypothetical protein [Polaribacter sp. Hel1_85]KGL64201.1 hypothetical protein PHEL85_1253 [Polaribacter sp. Hel1_85]